MLVGHSMKTGPIAKNKSEETTMKTKTTFFVLWVLANQKVATNLATINISKMCPVIHFEQWSLRRVCKLEQDQGQQLEPFWT